jgi:hypothetical protein
MLESIYLTLKSIFNHRGLLPGQGTRCTVDGQEGVESGFAEEDNTKFWILGWYTPRMCACLLRVLWERHPTKWYQISGVSIGYRTNPGEFLSGKEAHVGHVEGEFPTVHGDGSP